MAPPRSPLQRAARMVERVQRKEYDPAQEF